MTTPRIDYDEWQVIVNALKVHVISADNAFMAKEAARELRAWLAMEPKRRRDDDDDWAAEQAGDRKPDVEYPF